MSMFPGLGGQFLISVNASLTGITHTYSPQTFSNYRANNCGLVGNHDMSMFPGLGGQFLIYDNSALTSITHTASTEVFSSYYANDCDLTGNHDMSMLPGLGGVFRVYNNSNLTSITHAASTEVFTAYVANDCNLGISHDMSMLTGLGGYIRMYNNAILRTITFPLTSQTFKNLSNSNFNYAFSLNGADLNYCSFLPLSGATLDVNYAQGSTINLSDNGMISSEVNHYLVDFDNLSTNLNPSGWSGVTLFIGGSNAAPDSSSGGFNGIAALSSLTGGTNNWTVTTS